MDEIKAILENSPGFREEIKSMAGIFEKRRTCPGEILAQSGNTAHSYFLLGKGAVLCAFDDGRAVVLTRPGDFMGMQFLSDDAKYNATMTALDSGVVYAVLRQEFEKTCPADFKHETEVNFCTD
jgi:CRP-like cAMP-binding protein